MVEIQRVQSLTNIFIYIREIKKILKQYRLYRDLFNSNIFTTKELKEYIKVLISLHKQLKEFLKNTNKIFDN